MRVLIADDEPVYQVLLQELFDEWGFDVVVARDGNEAWELLQADPEIRMAILDWMMPGMDGYQVCARAREQASRDLYILLITGSTRKEDLERVLVVGADDYLIKPFEALDLKIRVRTAVRILNLQEELNRRETARTS